MQNNTMILRSTWLSKAAAMVTTIALFTGAVGPLSAVADSPSYSISVTSQVYGALSITLAGIASANPYTGQPDDHHVAVLNWGDGQSTSGSDVPFSITSESTHPKQFSAAWGAVSHTYASAGPRTITIKLYHAQPGGAESTDATIDVTVIIPPATVKVFKHVLNTHGGTKIASDFTMHVSGTGVSPATFAGSEAGTIVSVNPGVYAVTEDSVSGYTGSIGTNCSGTVASGDNRTCTITNSDRSNQPPTLTLSVGATVSIPELALFSFTSSASDPESDPLTFSISGDPAGSTFNTSTGAFSWTPSEAQGPGVYPVTVSVSDGANSASKTVTITVTEVNVAPILSAIGDKTVDENSLLQFAISGNDSDLPPNTLTYSATGLPSGAVFNSITQVFSWTPTFAQAGTYPSVHFAVSDGTLSDSEDITITVGNVNRPPVLSPIGDQIATELVALSLTASATDPDGDSLIYSLTSAPAGAAINFSTGAFSFTPTEAQGPGSYPVTISVTDGSATDSKSFTITVGEANIAPTVSGLAISTHQNTSHTVTLLASDPDLPASTLTFSIVSSPTNGTLGSITGDQVTYTPNSNYTGSDSFTYKVNDGTADSNIAAVSITVDDHAPTISPIADQIQTELVALSLTSVASDPDSDPLTFSISGDPAGSSFNTSTGAFSWTPSEAQGPGTYPVTISVTDGTMSDSTSFTITVGEENVAPVADDMSLTTNEDTSVAVSLSATDADIPAQTLTFSIASLPTHGTLGSVLGSMVTYTPDADFNGSDSFTYVANDSLTDSAPAIVSITVNAVNDEPTITLNGSDPMTLTVGDTFTDPGAVADDIEDGSVGVIGTGAVDTDTVGTYTVTYTYTDEDDATVSITRTVQVTAAPDTTPPVITLLGSATVNLSVGDSYLDLGATATDDVEGDITENIVTVNPVNTSVAGTYTITYNVSDSSGNAATEVERTVLVHVVVGPSAPACSDGIDNDGDGLVDMNDPGCDSLSDNDESGGTTTVIHTGGGGGGNGPLSGGGGGGGGGPAGQVLGASTALGQVLGVSAEMCEQYLTSYLRFGRVNNTEQVLRLQRFLRDLEGFSGVAETGVFDSASHAAVHAFQLRYAGDILAPWGIANSTGYVYYTTRKKINESYCKFTREFPLTDQQLAEIARVRELGARAFPSAGASVSPRTLPAPEKTVSPQETQEVGSGVQDTLPAAAVQALPTGGGNFFQRIWNRIFGR